MLTDYLGRCFAHWQIYRAIRRLADPRPDVRRQAVAELRLARPRCYKPLRRAAFRQRSLLAVHAAALLYDMDDAQGLYALLAQHSDRFLRVYYKPYLTDALQRVGGARIRDVLEVALDGIETSPLPREHWCLSLSVYALHALESLRFPLSDALWRRALAAHAPGFEDLRVCRNLFPVGDENHPRAARDEDWRTGSTLVAVRRAAVDALLASQPDTTFALLREALAHSAPEVQFTALHGLRRLRDPRALVLFQPLAADRRHPLSREARRAIEAFGDDQPDALTLVRAALPHTAKAEEELLRPARHADDVDIGTLLRVAPHKSRIF